MRLEWCFFKKKKAKTVSRNKFPFCVGRFTHKKSDHKAAYNLIIFLSVVLEGAESLPDHVNGNGKNNDGKEGG